MATYILLDPNEIVQQQQAMAAVAAAAANNNTNNNNNNLFANTIPHSTMPNKSSSSNDVSCIRTSFPRLLDFSSLFAFLFCYLLTD